MKFKVSEIFKTIIEWQLVQLELKHGSISEKKKDNTLKSFKQLYNKKKQKEWS